MESFRVSRPGVAASHWIACFGISLACHGIFLWIARPETRSRGASAAQPSIAVRLQVGQGLAITQNSSQLSIADSLAERNGKSPHSVENPDGLEMARMSGTTRRPESAPALVTSPVILPLGFDESAFAPASKLTVRPSPIGKITLPAPEDIVLTGYRAGTMTLFINEEGVVVRTRVDDSDLPPAFLDLGRETFTKARFYPGEIGGRPVKSRMRIALAIDRQPAANVKHPIPKAVPVP